MSEQSHEESLRIEGRLVTFDQIDRDGVQISSSTSIDMSGYESPLYISGVDHNGRYWAVVEPDFDSSGKLLGYSLISIKRQTRNGKNY